MILLRQFIPLLLLLIGCSAELAGQASNEYCATPPGRSEWLKSYQRAPEDYAVRSGELLYIPLTIHLVGTDEGKGFFTGEQLASALCILNEDFLPTDLQFYISGDIRYINNSTYYRHNFGQGFQMMESNNVPNTVNCYFVQDPAGACGYFSPGADGVAMSKGCSGPNSHTWAHELGHFFSLPHTFSGWEGTDYSPSSTTPEFINNRRVERMDGSFCNDSGDGFCDTPPDYLSYRWSCNSQNLSGVQQKDPQDSTFRSDGTFFMSYASDGCMNRFSEEQTAAMRANIQFQRPGLTTNSFIPDLISDTLQTALLAPDSGAVFGNTSLVTLQWEAVAGAIGYAIDFDFYVPFNGLTINYRSYTTTTNSLTLNDLQSNRTYIWRVRPFGRYDGCTTFSEPRSFSVGTFVNSTEWEAGDFGLKVFPQPLSASAGPLQISATLPSGGRATLRLINSSGQVVRTAAFETRAGINNTSLSADHLSPGFYLLELVCKDGRWVEKVTLAR
ncbi:MAG: zinc-dependent metalloprotease [Phaeodactylibacter sp.]|uniref:zinc-dependent metalloprotease n=1 Tax=Phaeodactylibacter sp. TaxID=1940289 RepID=UPI0032EBABF6